MTPDRCLEPVSNLKSKPKDYVEVEELGEKFIDDKSYGRNDLMAWLGVQDADVEWTMNWDFLTGQLKWVRLSEAYPSATLFPESRELMIYDPL